MLRLGAQVGLLIAAVSRVLDADREVRELDQARGDSLAELEASLTLAQQGAQEIVSRSPPQGAVGDHSAPADGSGLPRLRAIH